VKRIDTPETFKRFRGHVILLDPLPYKQVMAFSEASERTKMRFCQEGQKLWKKMIKEQDEKKREKLTEDLTIHFVECSESEKQPRCKTAMSTLAKNGTLLPAVLDCVQEWHVEGVPEKPTLQTFPGTPQPDSGQLLGWIIEELLDIITGESLEQADPNA